MTQNSAQWFVKPFLMELHGLEVELICSGFPRTSQAYQWKIHVPGMYQLHYPPFLQF